MKSALSSDLERCRADTDRAASRIAMALLPGHYWIQPITGSQPFAAWPPKHKPTRN